MQITDSGRDKCKWKRIGIIMEGILILVLLAVWFWRDGPEGVQATTGAKEAEKIAWVDFNVTYEALCLAYQWDVDTYGKEVHINWIETLAYLGAKYGGNFEENQKNWKKIWVNLQRNY